MKTADVARRAAEMLLAPAPEIAEGWPFATVGDLIDRNRSTDWDLLSHLLGGTEGLDASDRDVQRMGLAMAHADRAARRAAAFRTLPAVKAAWVAELVQRIDTL